MSVSTHCGWNETRAGASRWAYGYNSGSRPCQLTICGATTFCFRWRPASAFNSWGELPIRWPSRQPVGACSTGRLAEPSTPTRGRSVLASSSWLQTPYFDNSLGYTYTSDVANVEINQRFKLFSFDPYRALSWLWGVRYFYLSDDFVLSGSDLYGNTDEDLNWRTKNNLIGMQLGLQWTWGWDRFQLSTEAKAGLFANVYSQQGTDSINGSASYPGFDVSHSGTDLSALFEFSLLARFRVTECMWPRGLPVLLCDRAGNRSAQLGTQLAAMMPAAPWDWTACRWDWSWCGRAWERGALLRPSLTRSLRRNT